MMKAGMKYWLAILKNAVRLWLDVQAFTHAAALAFFTIFSVAPVMIVAVTIVGIVLGQEAAQGQLAQQIESFIGPNAAQAVQAAVDASRIEISGIFPTLAGIGTILLGATTVFAQMKISLNAVWGVSPRPTRSGLRVLIRARLLALAVIFLMSSVMLASLLLSVTVRVLVTFAEQWLPIPSLLLLALDAGIALFVATLLFAAIFRVLPDVVLEWRDVWLGALMTGLLFTLGRSLIAYYLSTTATASTYGAAASLVLLLLWVHYSSLILLFGVAFTRARLEARGLAVQPRATAIRVHLEIVEEPRNSSLH
jgi:membrane protein